VPHAGHFLPWERARVLSGTLEYLLVDLRHDRRGPDVTEPPVSLAAAMEEAAGVRKAALPEAGAAARVLASAFCDDPVFNWVLHGDRNRTRMLERGFDLFLRRVWMEQEETYTTPGVAGAAVWERPGSWQLSVGRQLRLLPAMATVFRNRLPRVLRALTVLEARHPREPPHYYLPFIGVAPEWQGRGIGAALLAPILERCDRERVPSFLEASTPRNRTLYERHGFTVTEEFRLARSAPPQWRMWREPAPKHAVA
jgi:GNAT superfamily N-acetyltransferase